jgi:pyruvate formate lyase activating enzyme
VQLLPFHQMGERKYEFLNRDYEMTGVKALHPEDLTEYRKVFLDHGIDCFF